MSLKRFASFLLVASASVATADGIKVGDLFEGDVKREALFYDAPYEACSLEVMAISSDEISLGVRLLDSSGQVKSAYEATMNRDGLWFLENIRFDYGFHAAPFRVPGTNLTGVHVQKVALGDGSLHYEFRETHTRDFYFNEGILTCLANLKIQ